MTPPGIWSCVRQRLAVAPAGTRLAYEKTSLPHPRAVGAYPSAGWPIGQFADFRFPPDSACRGLHVYEFSEHWLVQLDPVRPDADFAEHLVTGFPPPAGGAGALLGAVLGATIGRSAAGTILGGAVGLLAGTLLTQQPEPLIDHKPDP